MLQFGGAVGTLAALNDRGLDVSERLAALLDLPLPEAPWRTPSDRLAEVASAFAILAGTCGKIARDVSLLMQTDVAEAYEPAAPARRFIHHAAQTQSGRSRGGARGRDDRSQSARDHPRGATAGARARARRLAGGMADLSGAGARHLRRACMPLSTSPRGSKSTASACASTSRVTHGLIMAEAVAFALGTKLGKQEAHRIVEEASHKAIAAKRDLQEVLAENDQVTLSLSVGELARLFEPMGYQGSAQTFIDRIVGSLQGRGGKR